MSKALPLIVLKSVIVDDEDYELLKNTIWYVSVSSGRMYARRQTQKSRPVGETWMHRIIAQCPKGKIVHHINGNALDNRRHNLHVTTKELHHKGAYRPENTEKVPG